MPGTKARRTLVLAAVAAVSVALSGCANSDRDDDAGGGDGASASSKDTLVFGAAGEPKLFDPAFAADGKTWTFTLREGVKFTDGTDFNAEAVCFNFNRWYNFSGALQSPDVSAYWQDTFGGFAKNESPDLPESLFKSCTASNPTTVAIELSSATGRIPAALALPSFAMQSPAA